MKNRMIKTTISALTVGLLAGCSKSADRFSLLADAATFKQSEAYVQRKIDILWVIDNSGSMDTSQANLAANFQSFINRFEQLGYDFQMGVTTTDAYLAYHYNNDNRSRLKDRGKDTKGTANCGDDTDVVSGVRIMDRNTPNLSQVFLANIKQGICGSGDERGLSSMEHALQNDLNSSFRRPGAFLSVIIVSDEEDLSYYDWQDGVNSYAYFGTVGNPTLFPISRFTSALDQLTESTPGGVRNYSVSTIAVLDQACADTLNTDGFDRSVGNRYMQIADATEGTKGSLCSDFGNTLSTISDRVVSLASVFKLNREPVESTILVSIDGRRIANDPDNGWTYDPVNNAVSFHGSEIPPGGSDVRIFFEPKGVKL